MLTSTTHQAMAVLREMIPSTHECSIKTATVHKFMDYTIVYEQGKEVLKKIDPKEVPEDFDYLIIDEMSMLPRCILKEFLDGDLDERIAEKIILVGDPCQLKIDAFLDFTTIPTFELKENMRQNEDSELYKYCSKLRIAIDTKASPILIEPKDDEIDIYYSHQDFLKAYKSNTTEKVILAYMNKTVSAYNRNIKKYISKSALYSKGDDIIVTGPVKKRTMSGKMQTVYNNRERLKIRNVSECFNEVTEDDIVDPRYIVEHTELEVVNKKGVRGTIYVPKTKSALDKAMEPYKLNKNWFEFYKLKEKYNFVHHSYALTTYMAQGSTYDEVFIDFSDFTPPNDPAYQTLMSLVYVAMTRARNKVHIYMGDANNRDYGALK